MNPRSSSAEISRWTPDLDLRSSASRISSKLGEMPPCLEALVDEQQQFTLLGGEHGRHSPIQNERRTCRQQMRSGQAASKRRPLSCCACSAAPSSAAIACSLRFDLHILARARRRTGGA